MKSNRLFIFILVLGFPISVSAQIPIGYGVKTGVTSAKHYFEPTWSGRSYGSESRLGMNAAIFMEWLDTSQFTVLNQLEYTQRGMSSLFVEDNFTPTTWKITSRLDYLSFLIAGKIRTRANSVPMFFELGPRFDFLLGYQTEQGMNDNEYRNFKRVILGMSFGAGLEFTSLLPKRLMIEARYNMDLMDSFNDRYLKMWNETYDIWIGFRI